MKRILSLGAGVQSTTVLLMSCVGELEKLDAAVFADTQWEPPEVYEHLTWLEAEAAKAGIPVYRVTQGDLRAVTMDPDSTRTLLPLFIDMSDVVGKVRRKCTHDYKIAPVERKIKALLGFTPGARLPTTPKLEHWFGISFDERQRMRQSRVAWEYFHYPLIDLGMDRQACLDWCADHGYPIPPRSACVGSPFHSNAEWERIKGDPVTWADAVEVDRAIRTQKGVKGAAYLHRSLRPLDEVDFRSDDEKNGQMSLWGEECAGMCGV